MMRNVIVMLVVWALTLYAEDMMKTVEQVDLEQYIGTWYEIAKIPNTFQRKCTGDVTATYELRKDGRITVINKCRQANGQMDQAQGIARVADRETGAKLQVSFVSLFGLNLFWGDYWIIGLDDDYHYAVVGTPSQKYGWILCRETALTPEQEKQVNVILTKNGYDPSDFVKTNHGE